MVAADGLAVFAGAHLARVVSMQRIRWIAAALFFAFGVTALVAAAGLFY